MPRRPEILGNSERIEILTEVSERLSALSKHVRDLETAASSGRSKDEDKQKLAEILRRDEYQKPQEKGESLFQRWLREFLEWLANIFPRSSIPTETPSGLQPLSVILQFVIYGLVIALVGFLIYRFGPLLMERFRNRERKEIESRVILGERIDASTSATDLFAEAENLARQGDLRGAIRKGYVALLCELADRKVIGLARHKTNRDYLRDVRKRAPLFERMKAATRSFELHWYGFRPADRNDWEEFRDQFQRAVNEI